MQTEDLTNCTIERGARAFLELQPLSCADPLPSIVLVKGRLVFPPFLVNRGLANEPEEDMIKVFIKYISWVQLLE